MFRFDFFITAALALALVLIPSLALADAQPQGAANNPNAEDTTSQQVTKLSPIVVYGRRLPLPIVMQEIKTALNRPWSSSHEDLDKLVCRLQTRTGSHFKTLRCRTNRERIMAHQRGLSGLVETCYNGMCGRQVNGLALLALLKKLPPAGSSYTLRIPAANGKPTIDYVVKEGELVQILKYPDKKE